MPAEDPSDIVDRLLKLGAQMHVQVNARESMDIAHTCSTAAKEIRKLRRQIEKLQARQERLRG
jgi:negative regulator of replication initiation